MINGSVSSPDVRSESYSEGSCLRVGVLTNPRSGGNKRKLGEIHKVLAEWPETLTQEAFTPEGIRNALAGFAREGVDLVVLNGGDGTIQAALTAICSNDLFARPPLLALLCAGTTSMSARDVGIMGSSALALQRILAWAQSTDSSLVVRSRNVLRVQRSSQQPPLCGMFFGAGAICEGIRIFHSKDNPTGRRGQLMPALTMLRLLLAILFNNQDRLPALLNRTCIHGRQPEERADLLVLISTLDRLFLGMRPYWGDEGGPLRYTAVARSHKSLLKVLPSLFSSKKSRLAIPANGYYSHNLQEVQIQMDGEFTLDGELYPAGEGPVTISSAGPAPFLCTG